MTVEDFIALVPDGYRWLIRDDADGVFAHVYREQPGNPTADFIVSIKHRAPTPRAALSMCLQEIGVHR